MRPGSSEINETGVRGLVLQTVGRSAWWVMAPLLMSVSCAPPLWASSWDQIGSYLRLIQQTGVEALVANDCPEGLLGAFHEGRQALLMCGNNLPDDPASIWVVLAHESAHVMQFCKGGPLMPAAVLGAGMDQARRTDSQAFRELKLYNSSQHHVEAEARLVQALPPDQVRHLFEKHCAERLKS